MNHYSSDILRRAKIWKKSSTYNLNSVASNVKWKIFSNFVAFSEYLNITHKQPCLKMCMSCLLDLIRNMCLYSQFHGILEAKLFYQGPEISLLNGTRYGKHLNWGEKSGKNCQTVFRWTLQIKSTWNLKYMGYTSTWFLFRYITMTRWLVNKLEQELYNF